MRQLQAPHLVAVRAGEAAARVAEQLGLEQRLRQPRAIDRDERRVRARRTRVNVACDHVLAHAALARDQNLAVSRGNFRRGGQDRHHAWGAGDEEGLGDVLAARRRIHGSGLRPITATCGARDVAGGSNTLAGIAIGVPHRRRVRTVNGSAHGTYLLNSRGDSRSSITPRAITFITHVRSVRHRLCCALHRGITIALMKS